MKKKLKLKIFASFFLLVLMLAIAGLISIYEFWKLENSVHELIEDNYKSIEASKIMLEALEREDSGILLLMLGEWQEGREIISASDDQFKTAFEIAKNNLTELNEEEYIADIEKNYANYKNEWEKPIAETNKAGNMDWYKNNIHQLFLKTKKAVSALMEVNQESMHVEASALRERSRRAMLPGIVAIIAAVIFALLLNFFITRYFINPLSELSEAIVNFNPEKQQLTTNITSDDEIKKLEYSIDDLIQRLLKR